MSTENNEAGFTHADLAVLSVKLGTLHEDVGEIKDALKALTDAVTRLALVEQRQGQTASAMERAFRSLETLDARVSAIEKSLPTIAKTVSLVDKISLSVATAVITGAAVAYVLGK